MSGSARLKDGRGRRRSKPRSRSDLEELDFLLGLPERQTPLPGGGAACRAYLLVLARRPAGGLVVLAVEGKAREPFGEDTSPNGARPGLPAGTRGSPTSSSSCVSPTTSAPGGLSSQLLHRAAAGLIEAARLGAADAVLLVHAFKSRPVEPTCIGATRTSAASPPSPRRSGRGQPPARSLRPRSRGACGCTSAG